MYLKSHIYEKTNIIPINKKNENLSIKSNQNKNQNQNKNKEYSLKQNFFDPSKSSPPNNFMIKLYMRVSQLNNNEQ